MSRAHPSYYKVYGGERNSISAKLMSKTFMCVCVCVCVCVREREREREVAYIARIKTEAFYYLVCIYWSFFRVSEYQIRIKFA